MNLSQRMLDYEGRECGRTFIPRLPICVRLDGRCFHALTRNCARPFDADLHSLMTAVALELACETAAHVAYTQSDEITLILWSGNPQSQPYFGGRVQKIVSSLAAQASVAFTNRALSYCEELGEGTFDCRAWQVPSLEEAANVLIWREQDAARNSVQMAARSVFSHKQCHKKNTSQLQDMLHEKEINWNDYPAWAKRGTYLLRRKVLHELTEPEMEHIPLEHRPAGAVERRDYLYEHPRLAAVVDRVAYLFGDGSTSSQDERGSDAS